jgi:hypothetical protein
MISQVFIYLPKVVHPHTAVSRKFWEKIRALAMATAGRAVPMEHGHVDVIQDVAYNYYGNRCTPPHPALALLQLLELAT